MKNNDLAAVLAEKFGISLTEANDFIVAAFGVINDNLVGDDSSVKVKGLGTFKLLQTKERESIDINSGERIMLSGRQKINFAPDSSMRDRVNAPFANFTSIPLTGESEKTVNNDVVVPAITANIKKVAIVEEVEQNKNIATDDVNDNNEKNDIAEDSEVDNNNNSHWLWTILFAIMLGAAGGAAFYCFENNPIVASSSVETSAIDTTATIICSEPEATDSTTNSSAISILIPKIDEDHPFETDDPRIRLGAYIIIGTEKEVVIQKGQTFKGVCKAYLGPDMECYVQAYNGVQTATVGDTIKIPKIKLKRRK